MRVFSADNFFGAFEGGMVEDDRWSMIDEELWKRLRRHLRDTRNVIPHVIEPSKNSKLQNPVLNL